jgi:hypothetical protein
MTNQPQVPLPPLPPGARAETTISVGAPQAPRPRATGAQRPDLGGMSQAAGAQEEFMARRRAVQERASRAVEFADQDEREAAEREAELLAEAQAQEPLESIELQLPNGLEVEYGPPSGISITMKLIRMFGDSGWTTPRGTLYRVLMGVRRINGEAVNPINSIIDGEKLANRIGDEGMEILIRVQSQYWRPTPQVDMLVVKKNPR